MKSPGSLASVLSPYNILYRTTDSHCQPFWAVTTLFAPKQTNASALLSYQVPYNSADVDGSVGFLLYAATTPGNELLLSDIQTALGNGWFVNVPDYNDPLTSFGCGALQGMATLGSLRAVLNAGIGLSTAANIALWGYADGLHRQRECSRAARDLRPRAQNRRRCAGWPGVKLEQRNTGYRRHDLGWPAAGSHARAFLAMSGHDGILAFASQRTWTIQQDWFPRCQGHDQLLKHSWPTPTSPCSTTSRTALSFTIIPRCSMS